MAEKTLRVLSCDYCEGEILDADEDSARWSRELEPGSGWKKAKTREVLICVECRQVVTVARLLEMLLTVSTERT